jgi:hypothetical protein
MCQNFARFSNQNSSSHHETRLANDSADSKADQEQVSRQGTVALDATEAEVSSRA